MKRNNSRLVVIGNLYDYNGQNGVIYSPHGISPTLIASVKTIPHMLLVEDD